MSSCDTSLYNWFKVYSEGVFSTNSMPHTSGSACGQVLQTKMLMSPAPSLWIKKWESIEYLMSSDTLITAPCSFIFFYITALLDIGDLQNNIQHSSLYATRCPLKDLGGIPLPYSAEGGLEWTKGPFCVSLHAKVCSSEEGRLPQRGTLGMNQRSIMSSSPMTQRDTKHWWKHSSNPLQLTKAGYHYIIFKRSLCSGSGKHITWTCLLSTAWGLHVGH